MTRALGDSFEGESGKRRKKKVIYEPAQAAHIVQGLNELRQHLGLSTLKVKNDLQQWVPMIRAHEPIPLVSETYLLLSLLSFADDCDREASAPELIKKWMADPSRRPVIIGPGRYIYAEINEKDEQTRTAIVVIVLPF
jgi:hypothetical protein